MINEFAFREYTSSYFRREENEVRRMLSCWVSELEPVLVYHRLELVGLAAPSSVGEEVHVVIHAWE